VTNFPYPTPPLPLGLKEAIRCLEALGAMDPSSGNLTPLGRDMATLPVSPRHSRLILQVTPSPLLGSPFDDTPSVLEEHPHGKLLSKTKLSSLTFSTVNI